LHFQPVLGGLLALLVGTFLVWGLERQTRISTETVIGVVFSLALAVGSMLATGEELVDALLGAPSTLGGWELAFGLAGAATVVAFILTQRSRLVVALVSADIARTSGINVALLDLLYLLAFALTVALGLRYLGVLLMGSLVIIPSATAKHLARSLNGMFAIAVGVAVASTLVGELLAPRLHRATGPMIIATAAVAFLVSLVVHRRP
jgi:zinc transport system permease protein